MDTPSTALAKRRTRTAWLIWAAFCLAAGLVIVFDPDRTPVNQSYIDGALRWQAGQPLYEGNGHGFIYPPQAALLHLPLIHLPRVLYEFAWRFVTVGLFSVGVWRIAGCSRGSSIATVPALFLMITAMVLPKTWTVAVNGQATLAMAGLSLIAVADVAEARWWRATAALTLALAFKPLAIVLVLLLGALYRPLLWRLSLGGLLFLAVPWLGRDAAYVGAQYAAFGRTLDTAAGVGQQHDRIWPQLFSLLELAGLRFDETVQTGMALTAAVLTLAAAWRVSRTFSPRQSAVLIYSLAACYLLLMNPRTENNSYSLLTPVVAAFASRAILIEQSPGRSLLLASILFGLTAGFEICRLLNPGATFVWPCPAACLTFLVFVSHEIARPHAWDHAPRSHHAPRDAELRGASLT